MRSRPIRHRKSSHCWPTWVHHSTLHRSPRLNWRCSRVPQVSGYPSATRSKKKRCFARLPPRCFLFAVDSVEEVKKIAQAAPGTRVFCRILADGAGAEWPLSRKFGCSPAMAIEVLYCANALGLTPYGVAFHVGSQQTSLTAWNKSLVEASTIFRAMAKRGIELSAVNLGGGFPARYLKQVPNLSVYAQTIRSALADCFGNKRPDTIIEPGRGLVGDAGVIRAEVVLVSRKDYADAHRWVFLDIGKFGGLAETMEEAIRYPIVTSRDDDTKSPCIIAGPTCDSADVLYEKEPYPLPDTLVAGDEVMIDAAGAYTASYSTNGIQRFSTACSLHNLTSLGSTMSPIPLFTAHSLFEHKKLISTSGHSAAAQTEYSLVRRG